MQLSQDDVAELIAELEEEKLQLRIQSQRKNLTRSSARLEPDNVEDRKLTGPVSVDSSFQISPLDGKRLQLDPTDGAPSASVNWANRQTSNAGASGSNVEGNPFYNSQSRS